MAGRGPAPSGQHQRERDTKRRQAGTVLVAPDGVVRGPDLKGKYLQRTKDWWETWRRAPQAQLFAETDWLALQMAADLFDANLRAPSAAKASEIRLITERLGATYVDRQRARIVIQPEDEQAQLALVTPLAPAARTDAMARLRGETR